MLQQQNNYGFYFKVIFTSRSTWYDININDTVKNIIEHLTPIICHEFELDYCELVLTNQEHIPCEYGVALQPDDESLFVTRCPHPSLTGIYIRPFHYTLPECSICREVVASNSVTPYQCSHMYCFDCNVSCILHNINRCSLCRSL
jgi:hypothetical protein